MAGERLIIRPRRAAWGGPESAETAMLRNRFPDGAEVRAEGLKAYGEGAEEQGRRGCDEPQGMIENK